MKKIVLVLAVFTSAVWLSSSLFFACLKPNQSVAESPAAIIAMGDEDSSKTFRPTEFSAEVSVDENDRQASKVDSDVTKKLDQAKRDMMQICGSRLPAAVR